MDEYTKMHEQLDFLLETMELSLMTAIENPVTFTHLFEEGHVEEHDAHAEEVHHEETKGNWFTNLFSSWF